MAVVLQPGYFTSQVYVEALRQDVQTLIARFEERMDGSRPFALFKELWQSQGWPWMHFQVFDPRSRHAFLQTTIAVFLEHTQTPLSTVVALFAIYTLWHTQPAGTPPLHTLEHIAVPLAQYARLVALSDALATSPLRPYATHILYKLRQVIDIVPAPPTLPREILGGVSEKKAGRPSKREKTKKAREAIGQLDGWDVVMNGMEMESRVKYLEDKKEVLRAVDSAAVGRASASVLERVKRVDELAAAQGLEVGSEGGERTGLPRLARAGSRLLELMEGEGVG